jgi:hypothetical protein
MSTLVLFLACDQLKPCIGAGCIPALEDSDSSPPSSSLKISIPTYFYPDEGGLWDQVIAQAPVMGTVILNPNSGPGSSSDPNYVALAERLHSAGIQVLGYVSTRYGDRPIAEVQQDIGLYADWYQVDGIFLDEVPDESRCIGEKNYYQQAAELVRRRATVVVGNPGTRTCEDYLDFMDTLVLFEDTPTGWENYTAAPWMQNYEANRFSLLIHSQPDAALLPTLLEQAQKANFGQIFITDDVLPNPWDSLPGYWEDLVANLAAE